MNNTLDMESPSPALPPKRRRFTRVNVELVVHYTFVSSSGAPLSNSTFQGTSKDISGGGCLLQGSIPQLGWIPDLLTEEMKLDLKIDFPVDDFDLNTSAQVAWIDPQDKGEDQFQLGLEFEDLPDDKRKRIVDFVIRETTR